MAYVIYNKQTTQLYIFTRWSPWRLTRNYKTQAAAQAALTRLCRASGLLPTDPEYPQYVYGIAEEAYYYKNIEQTVTRKNLMTGREYTESVNTPNYCSPSSEAYWSA